ncbi:pre-mRNA-splicing factor syf1 [Friedmanniomyces endolithicus]|uniref:Pre-mRNA-splicing factor SYF1 n=1 Tax=Friedmanniomyces endolithicus TaxID=329885 RepID=A0AAN6KY09_9PEZI|nr:pre-mRNA-splicing factor syf1 [Friedmanniomyces endolithicus]KAK0779943.1 pre-mRNA-splicing factor syf1 [Friedmanniomyces endolithicus]KAK0820790.1 pre-mRNA-splicing factor syf1 [Friedmanniomyces endolithicus]KAK0869646.1 pre-mRNA-splicing factor syf1 [Friedmanniomyces endolithicus]KAK0873529.1 pre-mRNA-splicing factor syf1 [Friedmanniomyces endolithicus]
MGRHGELLRTLTPPFTITLGLSRPGSRKTSAETTSAPRMAETRRQQQQQQSYLYLIAQNDEVYENDILRDSSSIRPWLDYANFKRQYGTLLEQSFVLERAVTALPRSYKIWKIYLELRTKHLKGRNPARHRAEFQKVNALFERALVLLNKMPRIWEMYLSFLCQQPLVTFTRRTFDRALRALPLTQHHRIWVLYRPFANSAGGETSIKVWRRYMQIHPEDMEDFIELLVRERKYTEAVQRYIDILNNPRFKSKEAKGPFQLWTEMLETLIDHARAIPNPVPMLDAVDKVIRSGLQRFPDQRGILWLGLARYYINRGAYERARDVFEEGITTVMTVRDFSVVFDTYAEAEEALISIKLEDSATRQRKGRVDENADLDLDIRMMRFEQLMDRRPFLVNDVLLRQNPHNVNEWQKRVALWGENAQMVVQTYTDAIAAINPKKAVGRFHDLWTNYAKFYEAGGDLRNSRIILEKAVKVPYKSVSELAEMWTEWAELELRNENFDQAVNIMATATKAPKRSTVDYFDETLSPQQRVHKSWKIWSFYVDLVESVSTLDETKKVYERIFELKIATPQTVVNYANLLEEAGYHEDSFKIYERGLDLFSYPVAFELWNLYLTKAVDRKISIERLRDLFEQAVEDCPPTFAKTLYLMYGALEEERGLARHAMRIYERATRAVADADRSEMFEFYITKSTSNFGLTSTRSIYERAIAALPDKEAATMCVKFAEMERRLGEVDRARAIYGHASQFCDPRVEGQAAVFWKKWEGFEVACGNEETFKEMLRVKRSVLARFNTDVGFIAGQAVARQKAMEENGDDGEDMEVDAAGAAKLDAMAHLERQARAPVGFVAASAGPEGGNRKVQGDEAAPAVRNEEEIDIDEDL